MSGLLKALSAGRVLLVIVVVPLALVGVYYAGFAADRYVSEATVALQQSSSDGGAALPGAALLLAGVNPPLREETLYLKQYIESTGLMRDLDTKLGLRKHYSAQRVDLFARLREGASQEAFAEYYRGRVDVAMDELSSTLTLRVQGFDPQFAQTLNRQILAASEQFVNELSHQLAREQLAFAETELGRASGKLQAAREEVLAFQGKNKFLDPTVQAQASGAIVAEMQSAITRAEAELRNLRTFLNDDSFQVRALRSQIASTRAQLDAERARVTASGPDGNRLNALAIEFEALKMRAEFALDAYKLALSAVENARIEATRKLKSVVVIEPATLPETAEYPRRIYNLVTLLVACSLLYAIARLVLATIREHQD